MQTSDGCFVRN